MLNVKWVEKVRFVRFVCRAFQRQLKNPRILNYNFEMERKAELGWQGESSIICLMNKECLKILRGVQTGNISNSIGTFRWFWV